MDEEELRRLTELLELQMARLHRTFALQPPLDGMRLSASEMFVLTYLDTRGDAKISDLARAARLSTATMTQLCDVLEGYGLLARRRSSEDRRVVYAVLTEAGRATTRRIRESRMQRLIGVLRELGVEDLRTLTRITGRMVRILEQQNL